MKDDDFKLLRGFADRQTNEQTFVIVGSLLRLKRCYKGTSQSVNTKSLSALGLYKDQLRTQILKNKYQLRTKNDSKKED